MADKKPKKPLDQATKDYIKQIETPVTTANVTSIEVNFVAAVQTDIEQIKEAIKGNDAKGSDNKSLDKKAGVLEKIRSGIKAGVKENIEDVKTSAMNRIFDVPVFGTVLKNIHKELRKKNDDVDNEAPKIVSIDGALKNIEKSVIQISDNVYNIAAVVGAQLTSMQETEEALRQQRQEQERAAEEASTEGARPAIVGGEQKKPSMLESVGKMFGMEKVAKKVDAYVEKASDKAGKAAAKSASGLLGILTNPYALIATLVGAIGYGVYKYFTDDDFKKSINEIFQSVLDFDVVENIFKPLGDIFINIGAGLAKLAGMWYNYIGDISIPVPEFAQKLFGMSAELQPFGFMKETGGALEGWADKIFKQRRDERAAEKAAKEALKPPTPKAYAGTAVRTSTGQRNTTWAESVETAYEQAMPARKVPTITGDDKSVMAMIKEHEGVRLEPYQDSQGLWTIGVGHLIGDGRSLPKEWNRKITMEEADALFAQDYAIHKQAAEKIPGYNNLNKQGQAALIDLTFNMGPGWYKKWPSFTQALAEGDVQAATASLRDSKWYTQVGRRGPEIIALMSNGFDKPLRSNQLNQTAIASAPELPARKAANDNTFAGVKVAAISPSTPAIQQPLGVGKQQTLGSSASLTTSPSQAPGAVAAISPSTPNSGSTISTLTTTLSDLKMPSSNNNVSINNSKVGDTRMTSIMNGSIPSPIADRCSVDRFNFFEPVGNMKVA